MQLQLGLGLLELEYSKGSLSPQSPSKPIKAQLGPVVLEYMSSSVQMVGGRLSISRAMAAGGGEGMEEYVYRISTAAEWGELQSSGSIFGGELDKKSGFIHLSNLNQVKSTLQNFFVNTKVDLYLLQIDTNKLGEGLVYEVVDGSNSFPHFYGPSRSFIPLPLDAVTKAEKLHLSGGQFSCSMLERVA
ncbi:hypothetical protein TB2_025358 [Malus domestica]